MKKNCSAIVALVLSLLLSAAVVFAVDAKDKTAAPEAKGAAKAVTPEAKGTAKPAADKTKATTKAADEKTAVKGAIIDINSATEAELKAIPGIGDAFAAKIIAGRPYANKAQLKSRKILDGTLYEKVKEQLIAKQVKK